MDSKSKRQDPSYWSKRRRIRGRVETITRRIAIENVTVTDDANEIGNSSVLSYSGNQFQESNLVTDDSSTNMCGDQLSVTIPMMSSLSSETAENNSEWLLGIASGSICGSFLEQASADISSEFEESCSDEMLAHELADWAVTNNITHSALSVKKYS